MNKKIIALLLVVALAVSGAFAFGIGGMWSNVTGTSLTVAPQGHEGIYFGIGWNQWGSGTNGLTVSGEYKFWEWYFLDNIGGFFSWGLQAGAGVDVSIGFIGGFGLGLGVYGFFGTNLYFDFGKLGLEFFGQWQPHLYMNLVPSFGFYWPYAWGGYASGFRFWF